MTVQALHAVVPGPAVVTEPSGDLASRHRSTHSQMWVDFRPPVELTSADVDQERLDVLVLPTARAFSGDMVGLQLAFELASKYSALLVVVCSKDAKAAEFPWRLAKVMELDDVHGPKPRVIDFKDEDGCLPPSESAKSPIARFRRPVDTGPKRNLGLVIAKEYGAQNVLFLDDDIKSASDGSATLNTVGLGYAIRQLRENQNLQAIGWPASQEPDNSTACHLRRRIGLEQEIFIGAGALLVKMSDRIPHFPVSMYNEDWLFMMTLCERSPNYREALGWAGYVHQSASHQYSSDRAWSEEPGDLIGEALMNLIEDHGSAYWELADRDFWRKAVRSRIDMLCGLQSALKADARRPGTVAPVAQIDALRTARSAYSIIRPDDICTYLASVRTDQKEWSRFLGAVRPTSAGDLLTRNQADKIRPATV